MSKKILDKLLIWIKSIITSFKQKKVIIDFFEKLLSLLQYKINRSNLTIHLLENIMSKKILDKLLIWIKSIINHLKQKKVIINFFEKLSSLLQYKINRFNLTVKDLFVILTISIPTYSVFVDIFDFNDINQLLDIKESFINKNQSEINQEIIQDDSINENTNKYNYILEEKNKKKNSFWDYLAVFPKLRRIFNYFLKKKKDIFVPNINYHENMKQEEKFKMWEFKKNFEFNHPNKDRIYKLMIEAENRRNFNRYFVFWIGRFLRVPPTRNRNAGHNINLVDPIDIIGPRNYRSKP